VRLTCVFKTDDDDDDDEMTVSLHGHDSSNYG